MARKTRRRRRVRGTKRRIGTRRVSRRRLRGGFNFDALKEQAAQTFASTFTGVRAKAEALRSKLQQSDNKVDFDNQP